MPAITNIPSELINDSPGILSEIVNFILNRSRLKHPEFALASAMAVVAVASGRKTMDETGTTGNLYVLNIGPTGSGKESPRQALKQILQPFDLLSSERFTSDSAFVNELMYRPSMLCVSDEIGAMIEQINSTRASDHLKALADAMTQCFSSTGTIWPYKGYADQAKAKIVPYPNFCLHGSGNAETFFKALRPEKITDGFLGRFMMFLSANGGGRVHKPAKFTDAKPGDNQYSPLLPVPAVISDFIAKWCDLKTHDGNLESRHPAPIVLKRSAEARERLETHFEEITCRLPNDAGSTRASIWARSSEKSAKLALLSALARGADQIEICDANWGIALANFLTRRLVVLCGLHVAESPWHSKSLEILRRIQDHGRPIEHSSLLKISKVKSRDFNEHIAWLCETGEVVLAGRQTKGRTATGYALSSAVFESHSGWQVITPEMLKAARDKPPK